MPALPPAQAIKMEFIGSYLGTEWANIMHAAYSGTAPSPASLGTFATDVALSFGVNFVPYMNNGSQFQKVVFTDLSSDTGARVELPQSVNGGSSGGPLPAQVALGISWSIARRYRGGHSRTYLGGVDSSHVTEANKVLSSTQVALAGSAATFVADIASASGLTDPALAVVSYFAGGARRTVPLVEIVTDQTVHPRLDTQRRRLGKETT